METLSDDVVLGSEAVPDGSEMMHDAPSPLYLLMHEYRPPVDPGQEEKDETRRLQVIIDLLTQSADAGKPVLFAYVHPCHEEVAETKKPSPEFYVAGEIFATSGPQINPSADPSTAVPVLSAPGARGMMMPTEALGEKLAEFGHWRSVYYDYAPTNSQILAANPGTITGFSAEQFASSYQRPLAVVVQATPVPFEEVDRRLAAVADRHDTAAQDTDHIASVAETRKLAGLAGVLEEAQTRGLWDASVVVAAQDERDISAARLIAALSTSSGWKATLGEIQTSYAATVEEGKQRRLAMSLDQGGDDSGVQQISTAQLAPWFKPPDHEVNGYRVVEIPRYHQTMESDKAGLSPRQRVLIGQMLNPYKQVVGDIAFDARELLKHFFGDGISGMGKSALLRTIILATRVPTIVVDPKGGEFRVLGAQLAKHGIPVSVVRIGDSSQLMPGLNPLEPAPGFPLTEHIGLLRTLVISAIRMRETQAASGGSNSGGMGMFERYILDGLEGVIGKPLGGTYRDCGIDPKTGRALYDGGYGQFPTMQQLGTATVAAVEAQDFGRGTNAGNIPPVIESTFRGITEGNAGPFINGYNPIDMSVVLNINKPRLTIFEVDQLKDPVDMLMAMGMIILMAYEYSEVLKRQDLLPQDRLNLLLAVDEAHRVLYDGPLAEMYANLTLEGRAQGISTFYLDQSATDIHDQVVRGTGTKVMFRVQSAEDADGVGTLMGMNEAQRRHAQVLDPHEIIVMTPELDGPVFGRTIYDASLSQDKTKLSPLKEIMRPSDTGEFYKLGEHTYGQDLLNRTPAGMDGLNALVELTVLAHLNGLPGAHLIAPDRRAAAANGFDHFDYFDKIRKSTIKLPDGTVIDGQRAVNSAVEQAVRRAIESRAAAILDSADNPIGHPDRPLAPLVRQITAQVQAAVNGRPLATEAPDSLTLTSQRYAAAKAELAHHVLKAGSSTDRFHKSAEWEKHFGHPIPGATPTEQLKYLRNLDQREQTKRVLYARHPWGGTLIDQAVGASSNKALSETLKKIPDARAKAEMAQRLADAEVAAAGNANSSTAKQTATAAAASTLRRLTHGHADDITAWYTALGKMMDNFTIDTVTKQGIIEEYLTAMVAIKNEQVSKRGLLV